ncbi:MAG: DUF1446 domain-containing protein [Polyangiaceae bacterium]|nr:DUF1446 domain-containing protein [Polyangiaceae bacterium]
MSDEQRRAVRIANASGFFGDRMSAFVEVVRGGPVDVVTGDYMAEVTMAVLAKQRAKNPALGYVPTFLKQIAPVLAEIVARDIRVIVSAGGLNPSGLADAMRALSTKVGVSPKIAVVAGDDLAGRLDELRTANGGFRSLESGVELPTEPGFVYTANAYLGAWGIVRALQEGANIVLCSRVTDASLVVGAAAWWHGWKRDDWDRLAGAVAAGHVIECGPQATGGNFSSFRDIADLSRPAFPFAEVATDGSSVIGKHPGQGGAVTVGTVTAQLVYEVQTTRYLNPDVVTRLDTIHLEQLGVDRVAIRDVQGEPPPETTKVAITCRGRFRNVLTLAFVGLDIDEKIALFERTTRAAIDPAKVSVEFTRIGTPKTDADSQDEATVLLRVVGTSDDEDAVGRAFSSGLIEQALSSYPGMFATEVPGGAREATEYFPTLVRQIDLSHSVTHDDGRIEIVDVPPTMRAVSDTTSSPRVPSSSFGETVRGPLGLVVDARSGDKGSDANVGLWVRTDAAYDWLSAEVTVERFRQLLPEAASLTIERYDLPNLRALNFIVRGLLSGGAIATRRFDRQAKALGEFIRSRWVELPKKLL